MRDEKWGEKPAKRKMLRILTLSPLPQKRRRWRSRRGAYVYVNLCAVQGAPVRQGGSEKKGGHQKQGKAASTMAPMSFSDIFGEAEKGIHAHSFLGTAVVDYVLTLALAMFGTAVTGVPVVLTTIAAMVLSLIVHAAFDADTRTMRWIKARL
jgi:hypothetical protein